MPGSDLIAKRGCWDHPVMARESGGVTLGVAEGLEGWHLHGSPGLRHNRAVATVMDFDTKETVGCVKGLHRGEGRG
jgi:hypothetical protein